MNSLIHTRFDVIENAANRDEDRLLARYDLPIVPVVGELINVLGNPYLVQERGWAISDEGDDLGHLYCYIRLVRMFKESVVQEEEDGFMEVSAGEYGTF